MNKDQAKSTAKKGDEPGQEKTRKVVENKNQLSKGISKLSATGKTHESANYAKQRVMGSRKA